MKQSGFDEEEKIAIRREVKSGTPLKTVRAKHSISGPTYYVWKKKARGDGCR